LLHFCFAAWAVRPGANAAATASAAAQAVKKSGLAPPRHRLFG
jgi:hypothetical protein